MQAEQFLKLLQAPHKITPEEVRSLHDLVQLYPYFQAAYAMLAKAAYDQGHPSATQALQQAAVYATDRTHLRAMLENTPPFAAPVPEAPQEEAVTPQARGYDYVNSYIKTIQQKAHHTITNEKSLSQLASIEAFLQKSTDFKRNPMQSTSHESFQVDLTHESTSFNDALATESLAQVLWHQGKVQRALFIYEKLVLKFPEKKAYFTSCIAAIKEQI